jgi:hypothetical protein
MGYSLLMDTSNLQVGIRANGLQDIQTYEGIVLLELEGRWIPLAPHNRHAGTPYKNAGWD